ncbi:hypothetical protein PT2222_100324 [Paraburkholderia tropica]
MAMADVAGASSGHAQEQALR